MLRAWGLRRARESLPQRNARPLSAGRPALSSADNVDTRGAFTCAPGAVWRAQTPSKWRQIRKRAGARAGAHRDGCDEGRERLGERDLAVQVGVEGLQRQSLSLSLSLSPSPSLPLSLSPSPSLSESEPETSRRVRRLLWWACREALTVCLSVCPSLSLRLASWEVLFSLTYIYVCSSRLRKRNFYLRRY